MIAIVSPREYHEIGFYLMSRVIPVVLAVFDVQFNVGAPRQIVFSVRLEQIVVLLTDNVRAERVHSFAEDLCAGVLVHAGCIQGFAVCRKDRSILPSGTSFDQLNGRLQRREIAIDRDERAIKPVGGSMENPLHDILGDRPAIESQMD